MNHTAFVRFVSAGLWLLISFSVITSQEVQSKAQKLFAEAEELFAKETPDARAQAVPKYMEALALNRETKNESQQMLILDKLSDIAYYAGDVQKALAYSEEVLTLTQKLGEKNREAGVLGNMGLFLHSLGDTRKGIEHLENSARILNSLGAKEREAIALNSLGMLYNSSGEIQSASDTFNRSLVLRRETGDRIGESYTLINLGKSAADRGDLPKAVEFYEQALKIALELKNTHLESILANNFGSLRHDAGDFQKAFDSYQRSLELYRQSGNKYDESISLTNIAALYRDLGEFDRALDLLGQTLKIYQDGSFRRDEARTLSSMSVLHKLKGDRKKALELLRQASEIQQSLASNDGKAIILRNIGQLHLDENEPQKALESFQQAQRFAEESGDIASVADIQTITARAFESLNDLPNAEANFVAALSIQRKIGRMSDVAETLYHYAKLDKRKQRRSAAIEKMTEVFEITEDLRNSINGLNLRSSYLAEQQQYFDFYIELLISQHRIEPKKGFDARALQISESARARSLLESLNESQTDVRVGISSELIAKEKILRQTINAKEDQRIDAVSRQKPDKAVIIEKEVRETLEKYRELQNEIRQQNPQFAALTNPKPLTLTEIQAQLLDEDSILLEYSIGAERSFLFAVSKNSLDVFEMPNREIIEKAARQTIEKIKSSNPSVKTNLNDLSRILLAPVAEKIQSKRLLIVAPGILQYVPFAALPSPNTKTDSPLFLIETNEIVNLPSASVLALLQRGKPRQNQKHLAAILADPVFTADDVRLKQIVKRQGAQSPANDSSAVMREVKIVPPQLRSGFERLRFSRLEADAIAALTSNKPKFVAMDFAANLRAATGEDLQNSGIVHLATHGIINSDYPELSGVVLSLFDENGNPQDGFLRLTDIYNLRLNAGLVVLSACETALGKEIKGEGIVGLTRGFMYAGTPTVVASLWKVDDRATADLMRRFYQKMLKENLRPADALRQAQISMLRDKATQNPFYWAAFTVQGDYR